MSVRSTAPEMTRSYPVVDNDELDIDSFKAIVEPVTEWYIGELQRQGYDDAEELVAAFK